MQSLHNRVTGIGVTEEQGKILTNEKTFNGLFITEHF